MLDQDIIDDARRFRALAEAPDDVRISGVDGICLQTGLQKHSYQVQVILGKNWHHCYFADPPHGTPSYKAASKLEALRHAVDSALNSTGENQ